ncbi:protein-arginine deiminase type-2-like [Thalassophryne amazonica]|uniref:protein-arginine deiminase type-2-like n=1 Tax=Thalassophryne amazonica TaxID=390379 RepID=UPI001471C3AA|nr:protein-arginine deiminase type-2-like [Thalassophryne amazonica]
MDHSRTLRLDVDKPTNVVYVVGTQVTVDLDRTAPNGSKCFTVTCTPNINFSIHPAFNMDTSAHIPLQEHSFLLVSMTQASETENDSKLSVTFYRENKKELGKALMHLTAFEISLDVDADRDGVIEKNNPNKGSWKWGPRGHGAVLLVNCDSDSSHKKKPDSEQDFISTVKDLKDMSPMILRTKGPAKLPAGYKLNMHITQSEAEHVRVFRSRSAQLENYPLPPKLLYKYFVMEYPLVLSSEVLCQEVPYLGGEAEMKYYVEGLSFLDKDFDGFVSIQLSLLEPMYSNLPATPIFEDKVMFKVAPWIMTPNTLKPVQVFCCSTSDNQGFVKALKALVEKSGQELIVCPEYINRGDRWMQDEMEFGYIESPHQQFPVVLDSPRDRGLKGFPYMLLGPDFGYVTRIPKTEAVNSLDSFGNLEVSPPVTVKGKHYPLGRIIIGVSFPTESHGRNMAKVVQNFLWAQKVQDPIALFSDWLLVGHVDEFMTFVPAPDRKGFRLVLASPDAAYKLFTKLQKEGHGQVKLFEGLGESEEITVDDLLSNQTLEAENIYAQKCIDWNRDVLKHELGLEEEDIVDLPILFRLEDKVRAVAYYPDMVNMIVLGQNLGVPKPFGPKVNGQCALEAEVSSLMGKLGLSCTFIDDFATYHKLRGDVHCGSNVLRTPFEFKWWNLEM